MNSTVSLLSVLRIGTAAGRRVLHHRPLIAKIFGGNWIRVFHDAWNA